MKFQLRTRQLKRRTSRWFHGIRRIPLWLLLTTPFILNVLIVFSLVEYSSARQTKKDLNNVITKYSISLSNRTLANLSEEIIGENLNLDASNPKLLTQSVNKHLLQTEVDFSAKIALVDRNGVVIGSNHRQQDYFSSIAIQDILTHLRNQFGNLSNIKQIQQFDLETQQTTIKGRVIPWNNQKLGLNWLSIVTIPEAELLPDDTVPQTSKQSLGYQAYLLPTTILGVIIYVWVALSIKSLSKTASAIAKGQHNSSQVDTSRDLPIEELKVLEACLDRIAERLATSARQTESADRCIQSPLLADMSHELRSPLNAILGFAQIMQHESSMTRSQLENMVIINRSGKRLLSIINDVVDLSKMETNRFSLEQNSFDFAAWLDNIERSFRLKADSQGLEFSLIREENLPQNICIDEGRLRQILLNSVDYSIRYTQAGQVIVRVASCDSTLGNQLQTHDKVNIYFEIESTNCTIDREQVETLFDPSVSVRQKWKSPEHSSLSLPISRRLAQLMGGDLTVSNNLAGGITFRLDIQTEVNIPPQKLEILSTPKKVTGLEPGQPEYRILVVDDSKTNRKIMLHILEPIGFKVQEAVNGKEAIDVWLRWHPHMIWMDIRMPVMNGYEATERIKSYYSQTPSPPIVALTASTLEEERSLFLAAGCDDFVGKPFSENTIFSKIAQHLGVRYTYQSTPNLTPTSYKLTSEDLKIMPDSWLTQVEDAANTLDRDLITQLLQQIPPQHSDLKDALQKQVDKFDFDKILGLVRQSKNK
ncbi:MAG: response regulator [Pleurocapsa sp. MO_226.B13]|nr:response regulator [Pleurocapsa sp. MO_226.B13]